MTHPNGAAWHVPLALAAVAVLTLLVCTGIRRSSAANIAIISVTLSALVFFVVAGAPAATESGGTHPPLLCPNRVRPASPRWIPRSVCFDVRRLYGRRAHRNAWRRNPAPTPQYPACDHSDAAGLDGPLRRRRDGGHRRLGRPAFGTAGTVQAAPLGIVARQFPAPGAALVMAVGAVTAMLGVLLNLILGLSRALLAMGRRADMPAVLARLDRSGRTPTAAVVLVGAVIAARCSSAT